MKHLLIILFISQFAVTRGEVNKLDEKTIEKAKKTAFKFWSSPDIGMEPVIPDSGSEFYSRYDTLFRLVDETSAQIGYLVISAAFGRFDLFDFMVMYNSDLELVDLRILVYRSEYGSQVASRAWLKQFYGSPPSVDMEYGHDVDALSGATFSARSLTLQINRLNRLIAELPLK